MLLCCIDRTGICVQEDSTILNNTVFNILSVVILCSLIALCSVPVPTYLKPYSYILYTHNYDH